MNIVHKNNSMPRVLENVRERLVAELESMMADTTAGVSLRVLAERVGIGVGTIYNYFPDKDELILEVFRREWSRSIRAVCAAICEGDSEPETRVQRMLELLYDDLERLVQASGRRKAVMDGVAGGGNEHRAPLPLRPDIWRWLVQAFTPVWETIRETNDENTNDDDTNDATGARRPHGLGVRPGDDARSSTERLTVMMISTLGRLIVTFPSERRANIAFVRQLVVRGGCLYE